MSNLQLERVIYKKVNSFFDIKENFELEIENDIDVTVSYSDDNTICFATLNIETNAPKHPDAFNIHLEIVGVFKCENIVTDDDKKNAISPIYNYLFPYAQFMVSDLSIKAGLSQLMIVKNEVDLSNVIIDSN